MYKRRTVDAGRSCKRARTHVNAARKHVVADKRRSTTWARAGPARATKHVSTRFAVSVYEPQHADDRIAFHNDVELGAQRPHLPNEAMGNNPPGPPGVLDAQHVYRFKFILSRSTRCEVLRVCVSPYIFANALIGRVGPLWRDLDVSYTSTVVHEAKGGCRPETVSHSAT